MSGRIFFIIMEKFMAGTQKIDNLFEQLESALENERWEISTVIVAKLSKYCHEFNEETLEYYHYLESQLAADISYEDDWYTFEDEFLK